jgi:glycine/serine hydroxymethyltransferase
VAGSIAEILEAPDDEAVQARIADEVREMMERFPLPGVPRLN